MSSPQTILNSLHIGQAISDELIEKNPDTAIILLDVVMESQTGSDIILIDCSRSSIIVICNFSL